MLRRIAARVVVVVVAAGSVATYRAQEPADFSVLAAEAGRLQANREAAGDDESRASAALEWFRALQQVAAAIPFRQDEQEPYRTWLAEHRDLVVYNEPGGQWMLASRVVWEAHDGVRGTRPADELAWLAATNGLPGECEGRVAYCLRRTDLTTGEYLRRHPAGAHVEEAIVDLIVELAGDFELLSSLNPEWFFQPDRDCGDLAPTVEALSSAVRATSARRADDAGWLLERMGWRCEPSAR